MIELDEKQIESWRQHLKTGDSSGRWDGSADQLCDMALRSIALAEGARQMRDNFDSGGDGWWKGYRKLVKALTRSSDRGAKDA